MPQLIKQKTKTLTIRPNGRSADFITPNFIYGCAGGCRNSYCYVMRHNADTIYVNENVDQILAIIDNHLASLPLKTANQTDDTYWTYDIGCSTDVCLHWKHANWIKIFEFFKAHPQGKATFATKYVNTKLLDFDAQKKIRIRFSMMPQQVSSILEPKTSSILERINAINTFMEAGYDVHINFSPIVVYEGWTNQYQDLFEQLNKGINDQHKPFIKAECIFLTHNANQHARNLESNRIESESLIWRPELKKIRLVSMEGRQYAINEE